jgi:aspartate/methionine/tyrosine aminotransferase
MSRHAETRDLRHARLPQRDLETSTFLSRLHHRTTHHLSASECEAMSMTGLLRLADAEDAARWDAMDLSYTDPLGAPWLRATIAARYAGMGTQDLVCFAGAQEGLYATLHALLQPGDHAIVVVPGYQSVETLALSLAAVTGIALDAGDGWSLDIDAVAAAIRPNTRVVCVSFPNNPTGKLLETERFAALVALCRRHGIWLLSDEVYRLTEREPARRLPPAVDAYERGVSIGVLSKAYGLPGLRIGWVACRDGALIARIAALRQYLSVCSAGPSEVLANIALKATDTIIDRNRSIAEANLLVLRAFLARHPGRFAWTVPDGGVVGYVSYGGAEGVDCFVRRMTADAGVLLLPASVFRSDLVTLPDGRFRIGFGHSGFTAGLAAMEAALC